MSVSAASSPKLAGWTLEELVGEGASGVVYRARRKGSGDLAAIKIGRRMDEEAAILARLDRRYGPPLLDRGETENEDGDGGGEPFIALSWVERPKTAASLLEVAHGVARGLDELHASGVRHGDVKPANIVGTTLIDLDLATSVSSTTIAGGTPRYLAPEIRAGQAATPAADLYALGLVLAEIALPDLAKAETLDHDLIHQRIAKLKDAPDQATLIVALLAKNAGGRPSASWVAAYAARALGISPSNGDGGDADAVVEDRRARIRRTYLALRAHEIAKAKDIASSIGDPVRGWIKKAIWKGESTIAPLDAFGIARWIVSLVGPTAASWSITEDEATLAARLYDLAKVAPPEAWTYEEIVGKKSPTTGRLAIPKNGNDASGWIAVARALSLKTPDPRVFDDVEASLDNAPAEIRSALAEALLRRGDVGRAFAVVGPEKTALRAELLRRRGDLDAAADAARASNAHALLGRIAWDRGDVALAAKELGDEQGAAAAEVRALIAYSQSDPERGLSALEGVEAESDVGLARIEGTRGMLEHARGRPRESLAAFTRAVELATRAGAVVEEATYLTGLAAAGVDAGIVGPALLSATRGALLWGRLDRPNLAARAHLSRAAAYALVGATHEADLAAEETRRFAIASKDARAAAYARWAIVETRLPGDERARTEVLAADEELRECGTDEDRLRSAARVLIWGGGAPLSLDVTAADERVRALSGTTRWEWWGARAFSILSRRETGPSHRVLAEIVALLDVSAPLGSKGPALLAGVRLAREIGDGEIARRIEAARRSLITTLREGTPPTYQAALQSVAWLEGAAGGREHDDTGATPRPHAGLASAQVGELEAIVRALSSRDRLKPLLAQVLDTMVLWTGVERGLLLLRAPGEAGALVPRAARNLARQDLRDEQLALSMGLARRAMSEREAICATDAYAQVGDLHASVHALGLRSVLAVPLIARGDVLGVVYLDDRVRRDAFGPSELAWVRLVASQAALAIADARDQTLLRRAVRKAERANARLAAELGAREAELANVRAELASAGTGAETRFRYDEIAGRSEPMRAMLKLVDRVTMSEVPVLLAGESGTGKELVARAIHKNGPRASKAFVSENCGSVPETLLESTLFGHVRGAFTGASATRAGLFDVADGGTLFLDEIGEMPLAMQTKLLRVLQNGEVRPVGGERSHTVNVRIIGATHRDLEAMVAAGTFREDLFYRLNVVSIRIPPLRERREDIPLLVSRFVEKYSAEGDHNRGDNGNGSGGKKIKVTRAAMERLATFPWPGNVRQLENEVRRALVLADDRVDVGELSEEVSRGGPNATREAGLGLKARVDALETQLVRDALQKTQGNQTRAAEVLGISRFGLQKMMRRLGIKAQ